MERGNRRVIRTLGFAGLALITTLAYASAIGGGFIWDDDDYVTNNPTLRSLDGLGAIWLDPGATPQYYPLVFTSFWVEYQLWGLWASGYHLTNVLLHALAAGLLWLTLERLKIPGAFLAALVFAVHPVHVESVAWISERKNVLSGVFYLLSLYWFWSFLQSRDRSGQRRRATWLRYGMSLGLFVCALLAKSVTASLPAVILILLWWQRDRLRLADVLPVLPFFAVGAVISIPSAMIESGYTGVQSPLWDLSVPERLVIAGRALWFYLGKLVWPAELSFIYPRWDVDAARWTQLAFPLAAAAVPVALWSLRGKIGKGPVAAAAFFFATLFPALGFIDVYPMRFSFVADHFQYLASLGPIVLFAAVAATGFHRLSAAAGSAGARSTRAVAAVAAFAVVTALSLATWRQGRIYRDAPTLYRDIIARNPACVMAHNNLGVIYTGQGRNDLAIQAYGRAISIDPLQHESFLNRGRLYFVEGDYDAAFWDLKQAIEVDPRRGPDTPAILRLAHPVVDSDAAVRARLVPLLARVYFLLTRQETDRKLLAEAFESLGRVYRDESFPEAAAVADAYAGRFQVGTE